MNNEFLMAEIISPDPKLGKLGLFDMRKIAREVGSPQVALIAIGKDNELLTFFSLSPEKAREMATALLTLANEEVAADEEVAAE